MSDAIQEARPMTANPPAAANAGGQRRISGGLLDPQQLWKSLPDALRKLNPATLWRNPVMFIVEVGSVFTTVLAIASPSVFAWVTTVWLWLTVLFANLAEAVAEGRGKAQAENLRRTRTQTQAKRLGQAAGRQFEVVSALDLKEAIWCWSRPAT